MSGPCYECDGPIKTVVWDETEVFWVGREHARVWCSQRCLERSAEKYWERREREAYP